MSKENNSGYAKEWLTKEEWKKLLNEMLQEEGFDPEYIPVKYENNIGKEKIMKVGVEN